MTILTDQIFFLKLVGPELFNKAIVTIVLYWRPSATLADKLVQNCPNAYSVVLQSPQVCTKYLLLQKNRRKKDLHLLFSSILFGIQDCDDPSTFPLGHLSGQL